MRKNYKPKEIIIAGTKFAIVYKTMKDLSNSKRLHVAMKGYVEKVTEMVHRATKVQVGQIYKAYKSEEGLSKDADDGNLNLPENIMTLNVFSA